MNSAEAVLVLVVAAVAYLLGFWGGVLAEREAGETRRVRPPLRTMADTLDEPGLDRRW